MTFQQTDHLKNIEDSRWNSLNDAVLSLENHLFKIHPYDINGSKKHKQAFWLMNGLNKYNMRRTKLFNQFCKTDLTEAHWIEFNKNLESMEKTIVDLVNKRELELNDINFIIKPNFWLMDAYVRFKLQNCKAYLMKNGLDHDISDADLAETSTEQNNPLFHAPSDLKVNRETLTKFIGSKLSKKIDIELMAKIRNESTSLNDICALIENAICEGEIDLKDNLYSSKDIQEETINQLYLAKNTTNECDIMIETKSYSPFNREIKIVNQFLDRNPLVNYNGFLNNNPMLKEKDDDDRKKEKEERKAAIEEEKRREILKSKEFICKRYYHEIYKDYEKLNPGKINKMPDDDWNKLSGEFVKKAKLLMEEEWERLMEMKRGMG
jgi:hypothetical protein